MINEQEMKAAALRGLESEIRQSLSNRWGVGAKLDAVVTRTIEQNMPIVEAQINKALLEALGSPEFVTKLGDEMIRAMRGKFAGTFDGVMRAAGKKLAQDELARDAIVRAVKTQEPTP